MNRLLSLRIELCLSLRAFADGCAKQIAHPSLIEGKGTNLTGVIYQDGGTQLEICPPMGGPTGNENGLVPLPGVCLANGIPPLVSP